MTLWPDGDIQPNKCHIFVVWCLVNAKWCCSFPLASFSFALSTPWLLSWSSISVHCTSYKLFNSKQSWVAPSTARPPVDSVGLHQAYLFPFNFCSLKKFIYRITDLLLFKIKTQFHLWIIVCVGLLFWVSIDLIDLKVFQLLKSKSLFA